MFLFFAVGLALFLFFALRRPCFVVLFFFLALRSCFFFAFCNLAQGSVGQIKNKYVEIGSRMKFRNSTLRVQVSLLVIKAPSLARSLCCSFAFSALNLKRRATEALGPYGDIDVGAK